MRKPIYLGVNIDHVATLRQQRHTRYPDPVQAALQAEMAGADGITLHLREDRRHIQPEDVERLAACLQTRMNLEMAATPAMIEFALRIKPAHCCLVPERREELTTEGGLDVASQVSYLQEACQALANAGVEVSLFIDAEPTQIDATLACGAPVIELHTGQFADATDAKTQQAHLSRIAQAADYADKQGLIVNAGHGLHRHNLAPIAAIPVVNELNIGHSLIADAVFMGIEQAVRETKAMMLQARFASDLALSS